MIIVKLNRDEFESDVRAMIKAFYHDEFLYVECEQSKVQQQKKKPDEEITMEVIIRCGTTQMEIRIPQKKVSATCPTVENDRAKRRNDLKSLLYQEFYKLTNRKLPWGTLTGIRPTKIVMNLLNQGFSEDDIRYKMKEDYLISEEKLALSLTVAQKEAMLLGRLSEEKGYSLYVHVPFCPTTCLYCSFTSFPEHQYKEQMATYVEALIKELMFVAEAMKDKELNTIYFGGGTPTTLPEHLLERLLGFIKEQFDTGRLLEYTVEAGRPDSITKEKLLVLQKYGVSRISINPQTMQEKTLRTIGRKHTVAQTKEAFHLARTMGFDNINMDLIMGLPNETIDDMESTLKEIEKLHPDSLTVHSLARKHNAPLNLYAEDYGQLHFASTEEAMRLAEKTAAGMGLSPYYLYRQKNIAGNQENIGYAANEKEGIYNILIMEERQSILSVGAGAITKLIKTPGKLEQRVENIKDVNGYLHRVDEMIERKRKALFETGLLR